MMGIFQKWYDKIHPKPQPAALPAQPKIDDSAQRAIEKAHADLREAYLRRPRVEEVVSRSHLVLERNGLGAMIEASMGRKPT